MSNAWTDLWCVTSRSSNPWAWEDEGVEKQIVYLRRAIAEPHFGAVQERRESGNLGNSLNEIGRAQRLWNNGRACVLENSGCFGRITRKVWFIMGLPPQASRCDHCFESEHTDLKKRSNCEHLPRPPSTLRISSTPRAHLLDSHWETISLRRKESWTFKAEIISNLGT